MECVEGGLNFLFTFHNNFLRQASVHLLNNNIIWDIECGIMCCIQVIIIPIIIIMHPHHTYYFAKRNEDQSISFFFGERKNQKECTDLVE